MPSTAVGGDEPVAAVEQAAQDEEHDRRADAMYAAGSRSEPRSRTMRRTGALGGVDHRDRPAPGRLGAQRHERRHLDQRVVRLVPERRSGRARRRTASGCLAADLVHVDDVELAGLEDILSSRMSSAAAPACPYSGADWRPGSSPRLDELGRRPASATCAASSGRWRRPAVEDVSRRAAADVSGPRSGRPPASTAASPLRPMP